MISRKLVEKKSTEKKLNVIEHKQQSPVGRQELVKIYHHRINPLHSNCGTSFYINRFRLNKHFLESISSKTKIMEIGVGTGNVAKYLLAHSKIEKHNYSLIEMNYDGLPKWKKDNLTNLERYHKISVTKENIFFGKLPEGRYNHILLVESFDPAMYFVRELARGSIHEISLEDQYDKVVQAIATKNKIDFDKAVVVLEGKAFMELAEKLKPSLEDNGDIRISPVSNILIGLINEYPDKMKPKGFEIEVINSDKSFSSVLLRKIKE